MLMGEALDGLERSADAIAEFQAAVKAAPQEPGVHFGLGYLYWKASQYDEAKAEFETELDIDPGNPQALAYLGDVELKLNDPEKALVLLKKAVDARDDIRIAYADIGSIYVQQKKYGEALEAYQRAVKLDPEQPDMHFRLGNLYRQIGNTATSEEEFAKSRALHKKADDALLKKLSDAPPALHP
jgi:tetratricopeptide (TPR) repeat protein